VVDLFLNIYMEIIDLTHKNIFLNNNNVYKKRSTVKVVLKVSLIGLQIGFQYSPIVLQTTSKAFSIVLIIRVEN